MRENEIWLTPYGGLANRMRAVNSMAEFARQTATPLKVVWFSNFELNAPFSSLFLPLPDNVPVKEAGFSSRFIYRSPRRNNLWLPNFLQPLKFDRIIYHQEFIKLRDNGQLAAALLSGGRVFVESCYDFGLYSSALESNFKPVPHLQEAVDKFVAENFAERTVGVHIRRTDNALSIKRSPATLFIAAMQRETELFPGVKFFVASDDESEKELLKKHFGDKIITRQADCSRDTIRGIESAVEDMYILSRTSKIYGSFYSSFSEIAARIGGLEIEVLTAD